MHPIRRGSHGRSAHLCLLLALTLAGCTASKVSVHGLASTSPSGPGSGLGSVSRSQGEVLALRLQGIFPDFPTDTISKGNGLGGFLGQADFRNSFHSQNSISTVAQVTFRNTISEYCARSPGSQNALFDLATALKPGETAPADSNTRDALAAARNGWLYPFEPASPEVQALAQLYRSELNAGRNAAQGHQTVCLAVFLAPQFWLGNPGAADVIRRLALNLGHRRPSFQEFADFSAGRMTAASYVKKLQAETGYLKSVKLWHREWLGTMDLNAYFGRMADFRGNKYNFGWSGATSLGAQTFLLVPSTSPVTTPNKLVLGLQNTWPDFHTPLSTIRDSEYCDENLQQDFDPRTDAIRWEQKNPVNGLWEALGSYHKVNGSWSMSAGSVTLDGGGAKATNVADITNAIAVGPDRPGYYQYQPSSGLFATPMKQFKPEDLRVIRSFQGVDQVGYSKIKLWWSGESASVCNNLTHFAATCAFRPVDPGAGSNSGGKFPYFLGQNGPGLPEATFNASIPAISMVGALDGSTFNKNAYAHPTILESMSCGVPHPDETSETDAYPKTPPYNEIGTNFIAATANLSAMIGVRNPEQATIQQIIDDMNDEPGALLEDIVQGQKDYRLLLTAPYTFGRGALDLLYRSQAYYLPAYPPGQYETPASGGPGFSTPHLIRSSSFTSFSKNWMKNSYGSYLSQWVIADKVTPRPMSGVLTQAAFLAPGGYKMRSISARVFRTFTCNDVNGFAPSAGQSATHLPFIPTKESTGAQHVNPKQGCITCHINMDPLAASLSLGFHDHIGDSVPEQFGLPSEFMAFYNGDLYQSFTYGIRGYSQPSKGALLGQPISGVQEVGQVLSNSDAFARCSARRTFAGIFGRDPIQDSAVEQALIQSAAERLKATGYNYDRMVEWLATSPSFLQEN